MSAHKALKNKHVPKHTNSGVPCDDCCCAVVGSGIELSFELEAFGSCEGHSSLSSSCF